MADAFRWRTLAVRRNDKTHAHITDKEFKNERQIVLKHGQPMIFGDNNDKGIVLDGFNLKVVKIGENGITEKDILVHDAYEPNPFLHLMLVNMQPTEFPVALGVIRAVAAPNYTDSLQEQINFVQESSKIKCMDDLLRSGNTWEVE